MPWCEDCSKYFTPNSVNEDGSCPTCGEVIQAPESASTDADHSTADDEKTPWHFKLMVGAVAVYLGWRVVQLFA